MFRLHLKCELNNIALAFSSSNDCHLCWLWTKYRNGDTLEKIERRARQYSKRSIFMVALLRATGCRRSTARRHTCREKTISVEFMKKYIHIAKGIKPTLTQGACDQIAEEYARLRSFDTENTDVARVRP